MKNLEQQKTLRSIRAKLPIEYLWLHPFANTDSFLLRNLSPVDTSKKKKSIYFPVACSSILFFDSNWRIRSFFSSLSLSYLVWKNILFHVSREIASFLIREYRRRFSRSSISLVRLSPLIIDCWMKKCDQLSAAIIHLKEKKSNEQKVFFLTSGHCREVNDRLMDLSRRLLFFAPFISFRQHRSK